jgi:cell wall-associated NlpC family hydrolase
MVEKVYLSVIVFGFFSACINPDKKPIVLPVLDTIIVIPDSIKSAEPSPETENKQTTDTIKTGKTKPADIVAYAKTLIGIPYKYASADPSVGFDCSGFITYVFRHFNISVPRSSVDFTNVGTGISTKEAKAGDLILFTGTDSTIHVVGHMGIIVSNEAGQLQFIHSTSGKAKGVVITAFGDYYKSRFVKVIRVFS